MVDAEAIGGAARKGPGAAENGRDVDDRQGLDGKLIMALERVGHALRTELRVRAQEEGLTLTQAEILLRLASGRLGQRRVGALAREFDVRQPTISDAVTALERKGLLERRASVADARSTELVLTETGLQAVGRLETWEQPARAALSQMPEAEKEVTLSLLIDLIAGLHRTGSIQVARTCRTCRFFRPGVEGPNEGTQGAGAGAPGGGSGSGTGRGPHCALLDMDLGPADLRVDCPEHEPVAAT